MNTQNAQNQPEPIGAYQAPAGGMYGKNGAWYRGGQFLPSSEFTEKGASGPQWELPKRTAETVGNAWRYIHNNPVAFAMVWIAEDFPEEGFFWSLRNALFNYGALTERQEAAMWRAVKEWRERQEKRARDAEIYERAENVPVGRAEIRGEILATKIQDSPYGTQYKMLVRDERGFKVWGTVPSKIDYVEMQSGDVNYSRYLERGDKVAFTARVTPSPDDPKFGFYKRPTKPRILAVALDK